MPAVKKEKNVPEIPHVDICNQVKVKEAINVLKLLEEKFVEKDSRKQPLLENAAESFIFLQITLKKIPPPQFLKMIRVPLPHSLITETTEICLITGDLEKRNHKAEIEPTVLHYKDLLKKHGVTNVAQVIPIRQLRTEYKTFESKRQLAAAYDVFLVDKKIAGVMPKVLGKSFFHSRKFPIQINMKRQDLKKEIDKALCQVEFSLTCRGNSYALEIARLSMENDAVVQNIMTSIDVLANKLPGKENNILNLYLKTSKSKAIPIFVTLDTSDEMRIKKLHKNRSRVDELSTIDDAEVKVFRDGRVKLLKRNRSSFQGITANKVSFRKKRSKKADDLTEITDNTELENKKSFRVSVSNKQSPKKKKGRKSTSLGHQVADSSLIESEDIPDSVNKKDKKYITDNISNNEEDNQNTSIHKVSLMKNAKNLNHVEAPKEVEENSRFLKSKKRKIYENDAVNENPRKIKDKKILESEDSGKIGKKNQSKLFDKHVNVKTPKSKKAKNGKDVIDAVKMEASVTEKMQDEETPSKSKKRKEGSTGAHILSSLSKTKKVKKIKMK